MTVKRIAAVLLLILIGIFAFIWYKGSGQKLQDEDGNPLRYTYEDIEAEGLTGVFVLNSDETFSPAIKTMPNFQGSTTDSNPSRYIWYVESDKTTDELIPTVTKDSKLVVVYNVDGDLPGTHYLERYDVKGYTIGAHISLKEDKTMFLNAEKALSGSQAAALLSSIESNTDNTYTISAISGSEVLPIKNIDPNMNMLLGLEKDKLYQIRYFQGTKEKTATFKADAKVFQSSRYIPITTPYKKTREGYFIVNLPQNLEDGFYYLSAIGFFKYKR